MIKAVCELLPLLVEKNQRAFDDGTPPVEDRAGADVALTNAVRASGGDCG
jgi:hypothetical protein